MKLNYDHIAFLDVHAAKNMWMYPYSYSKDLCQDNDLLKSISEDAVTALQKVHGTEFSYGSIANTIYPASGTSSDYFYEKLGVRCSFAIELREQTGRNSFGYPFDHTKDQIKPTAEEMAAAYKVVLQNVIAGKCRKI